LLRELVAADLRMRVIDLDTLIEISAEQDAHATASWFRS
jgi:hypothetical protein